MRHITNELNYVHGHVPLIQYSWSYKKNNQIPIINLNI